MNPTLDADVIVIGAGLSGLQAAFTAHEAGLSILVLEARGRVGGKTWSAPLASGRGCVELGAAWINDTNQRRMWAYAQKFGLEMQKQNVDGDGLMEDVDGEVLRFAYGNSPKFSEADVQDLERVRDHIQALSVKAMDASFSLEAQDEVTLAELVQSLGATDRTNRIVNIWARVMLGVEASVVSARFFIDYCAKGGSLMTMRSDSKHGGQYLRFYDGSQTISRRMAASLPVGNVLLNQNVKKIDDHGDRVTVTTKLGRSYSGKKLILSIPTILYRHIEFNPPLLGTKKTAVEGTELGFYTKVILCYDTAWWVDMNLCGLTLSFHGPVIVSRDTSVPAKRQFSLTYFVNGDVGVEWSLLPAHERRERVLDHIWSLFGNSGVGKLRKEIVYNTIEVFEMQWSKEEWSEGAPCPVTRPRMMNETSEWMKRAVGNIHFVGTEFAKEWKGYMEGALASGEDGGKEVIEALKDRA